MTAPEPTADVDGPRRITLTVAEAAAELGVATDAVMRWIGLGELSVFLPPGKALGVGRGPKGILIFRDDWSEFLRARRVTARPAQPEPEGEKPAPARRAPVAAGTDGKSRRRRRGA